MMMAVAAMNDGLVEGRALGLGLGLGMGIDEWPEMW